MNGSAEVASELAQRLRKVRALTESSVPGEAAAAAAKLQEILLKHNLEMEDIEDDSSHVDDRYVKEPLELGESFGGMINWRRILISGVARSLMCAAFSYKGTRDMVIVGQKHNIEMTRHFYDYLSGEIARLADVKWEEARASSRESARSWKSSFYNGAVDIVVKRLHRKYQQVSQESERSQALVLKNERDLDGAVANLVGRVGRSKVYQKRSRAGYSRGAQTAKGIRLDRPVSGGAKSRRLPNP